MPIRSLLLPFLIVFGTGLAAAQALPDAPTPRPVIPAPHYTGPIGINPYPSTFPAAQTDKNPLAATPPKITNAPRVASGQMAKLILPGSRKSTCYAIRGYAFTPSSDTVGITHPSSESTCVAASSSGMKQAGPPSAGR
jgi:hypothetical protein